MAFEIGTFASKLASTRPRTIEVVTEEAHAAKAQITTGFLDLGARLNEAKELLAHGEWLPWLEREMQFSERTAQKFMALAREYEGNPQLASDLGSEKAFALLALPREEREEIAQHGVTVDGKTKAASDLTTREVKQIVAERKADKPIDFRAMDYLIERANEDARYRELLRDRDFWRSLVDSMVAAGNRQAGIDILKTAWRNRGGSYMHGGYTGSGKGLSLYGDDHVFIERTWTEVWDMLAVMALHEVACEDMKKPLPFEPPEGQLAISGWMPGGTNPGRESGSCVCMMPINPNGEPVARVLYWDGAAAQWRFCDGGQTVNMEPVGWMRLPEWRN